MLSDDELVEQILLGNENVAEELIKRYYTSILRYCRWHCSNLEKAEDLTQETFLKLFKNLSGYKGKKKFKAYLYTIANHLCIDETALSKGELYTIGSVVILGGLSLVNSLHAYTFASLKRKKLISTTPLNDALNALILALNASAAAFVLLFTKKFKILS